MAKEIERKFLIRKPVPCAEKADSAHRIIQAYLSVVPESTVRVRVIDNKQARLTVKGLNHGIERDEWEYEIPVTDALEMLERLPVKSLIDKTRMKIGRWELDIFHGKLDGLAVAEIELNSTDEKIDFPSFIGREVTGDIRYYNSELGSCSEAPPTE